MENDKIIVHSTYYNPIEANIVKGRLEDSDIPCFLTDENVATINPLYNQAIGGVKLNVFEKDMPRINELLTDILPDIETDVDEVSEEQILCEKCGSNNVGYGQATKRRFNWLVTVVSLIFTIYPFKANNCYHCYNCGHEFK